MGGMGGLLTYWMPAVNDGAAGAVDVPELVVEAWLLVVGRVLLEVVALDVEVIAGAEVEVVALDVEVIACAELDFVLVGVTGLVVAVTVLVVYGTVVVLAGEVVVTTFVVVRIH